MPLSPPTKSTMIVALILFIVGLILCVLGYIGIFPPDFLPVDMNTNTFVYILGYIIPAIGWILIFIGTRVKGM